MKLCVYIGIWICLYYIYEKTLQIRDCQKIYCLSYSQWLKNNRKFSV